MIIDAHLHLYPPSVYKDPKSWASVRGETYWQACVAPPEKRSLQAWASVSQLVAHMDEAGVDRAVILGWYWETQDTCEENLSWQMEWLRQQPDRFLCFAPFNAKGGQRALDLLKRALDLGFHGVGEINPPAQGYRYDDPTLQQAVELAAQAGVPLNVHVTDPATRDYPGKIATPFPALFQLARDHPDARFVFAHLGGLAPLTDGSETPPNVWYDTAACPLLYDASVYAEFCRAVGPDRVLFGTDYPLRVFPRHPQSPDFLLPLEQLRESGIPPTELDQILGRNAANLLNIQT